MAIQVSGTTVIDNGRALNNITSIDATTAAAIGAGGVGGGLEVVTVTGNNPSLDLSAGDVFFHSGYTADPTISFSNIPQKKNWKYITESTFSSSSYSDGVVLKSALSGSGYGSVFSIPIAQIQAGTYPPVVDALYDANNTLSTVHGSSISQIIVNTARNKILTFSKGAGTLRSHTLSTANDLTTLSTRSGSYSTGANIRNGNFTPDGTKFIVTDSGDYVNTLPLNNAFQHELSTSNATGKHLPTSTFPNGGYVGNAQWGNNGTYLYVVTSASECHRFTASTPYNTSTINTSTRVTSTGIFNNSYDAHATMAVSPDGSNIIVSSANNISVYEMTTPWDISTTSVNNIVSTNVTQYSFYPMHGCMNEDAQLFVTSGAQSYQVVQIDFRSPLTPSFSSFSSSTQPVNTGSILSDNPLSVDFTTVNTGSTIYAATSYEGSIG